MALIRFRYLESDFYFYIYKLINWFLIITIASGEGGQTINTPIFLL